MAQGGAMVNRMSSVYQSRRMIAHTFVHTRPIEDCLVRMRRKEELVVGPRPFQGRLAQQAIGDR